MSEENYAQLIAGNIGECTINPSTAKCNSKSKNEMIKWIKLLPKNSKFIVWGGLPSTHLIMEAFIVEDTADE